MITKVPGAYWPKDSIPVWRYLSFDKLINLLIHREIQFTRASLFTDQNEMRFLDASKGEDKVTPQQAEQLEKRIRTLRDTTFVSCWSLGRSDSYPLWKIYLGGSRNGIAIRSTVGRLRASLEQSPNNYFIGGVQYRRSAFDDIPTDEQLICAKLEAYEYEREFRVFTRNPKRTHVLGDSSFTPNIMSEPIDIGRMLKSIYISPFASNWFETTVKDAISRLAPDLEVPIRTSKIQDQ
jgi:hypothetical protein